MNLEFTFIENIFFDNRVGRYNIPYSPNESYGIKWYLHVNEYFSKPIISAYYIEKYFNMNDSNYYSAHYKETQNNQRSHGIRTETLEEAQNWLKQNYYNLLIKHAKYRKELFVEK
jgi:hypothetical protein